MQPLYLRNFKQLVNFIKNAKQFTQELRNYLGERFRIAVRVRSVGQGKGYRLFQVQKPHNRCLVDVRSVETLPSAQRIADVLVMAPAELIASKVMAYYRRRGQPKSGTDWRDLTILILTFPEFKRDPNPVADCLRTAGADPAVLTLWREFAAQEIHSEDENSKF